MVKRIASKRIRELLKQFPVVGIIGPRQCGKTTLAKSLIETNKNKFYLDLEKPSNLDKLDDAELYLSQFSNKQIVIDEIQRKPSLFPLLRSLIDENRKPGRFIILGSANPNVIKYSSESLAGRISYVELSPFNLLEINKNISMRKHWFIGGLPNAILEENEKASINWLDSYIQTFIERDLALLGLFAETINMRRLWVMIARFNSEILNMHKFAESIGLSLPTIRKYFDFLEGAFIIRRLYPFYSNIKKRLVKSPKIYIRDNGILHRLLYLNNLDDLFNSTFTGSSWESYCIEQIRQLINNQIQLYYYRTHSGAEIDLVFVKGIKPIATAEIKHSLSPTLTKGNLSAISDLGTKNNFIIYSGNENYLKRKEIRVCSLETFLKKYLPKIIV